MRIRDIIESKYSIPYVGNLIADELGATGYQRIRPGSVVPWGDDYMGGNGYIITTPEGRVFLDADVEKGTIYLSQISVDNRRSGLGTRVMEALRHAALKLGYDILVYKVTNHGFFERFAWLKKLPSGNYRFQITDIQESKGHPLVVYTKPMRLSEVVSDQNPFVGMPLEKFVLPANTPLFHGTDRPLESWNPAEEEIWTPAWFGLTKRVAKEYATFRRSSEKGKPVVYEFVTTHPLNLLEGSEEPIKGLMDELYGSYTTDDISGWVLALGYEGWHIKSIEVMIGYSDMIRFVREV